MPVGRATRKASGKVARRSLPILWVVGNERPASVNRGDQAAVPEYFHRPSDGAVGHAVVASQVPFAEQSRSRRQFARRDPRGDVVGNTEVRQIGIPAALRLKIAHSITIVILTCINASGSYYDALQSLTRALHEE